MSSDEGRWLEGLDEQTERERKDEVEWPEHPWGAYCGGIVWNRAGGGYNGVDGQCSRELNHDGECET